MGDIGLQYLTTKQLSNYRTLKLCKNDHYLGKNDITSTGIDSLINNRIDLSQLRELFLSRTYSNQIPIA